MDSENYKEIGIAEMGFELEDWYLYNRLSDIQLRDLPHSMELKRQQWKKKYGENNNETFGFWSEVSE